MIVFAGGLNLLEKLWTLVDRFNLLTDYWLVNVFNWSALIITEYVQLYATEEALAAQQNDESDSSSEASSLSSSDDEDDV